MSYNSLFGFLALAIYVCTLIPSNITKVFPHTRKWKINRLLLQKRRLLGLVAFSLSIDHLLISITKHQIRLFELKTYSTYYTGVSIFTIFTLLALTSNNWSIKKLKHKWHLLHKLTYLAMFLLMWHILSLMTDSWTFLTPIGLNLISISCLMYLTRLVLQLRKRIIEKRELSYETPKLLSDTVHTVQNEPVNNQSRKCENIEIS